MFLKQYYLGCLAHASYLLADDESKTAVVVDPQRDVDQYVADAEARGVQIRHVFLTHFHADFIAGHLELRDRCGADIRLGAQAKAEYAFVPMRDGDSLDFPGMRLQVIETPGHTIESISILVFDREQSDEKPHASPAIHCSSAMSAGRICARRSAGPLRTWRVTSTNRFTESSWRFPTKRWSTRHMAPDRCAARICPPTPYPRWASSESLTMPCSR